MGFVREEKRFCDIIPLMISHEDPTMLILLIFLSDLVISLPFLAAILGLVTSVF